MLWFQASDLNFVSKLLVPKVSLNDQISMSLKSKQSRYFKGFLILHTSHVSQTLCKAWFTFVFVNRISHRAKRKSDCQVSKVRSKNLKEMLSGLKCLKSGWYEVGTWPTCWDCWRNLWMWKFWSGSESTYLVKMRVTSTYIVFLAQQAWSCAQVDNYCQTITYLELQKHVCLSSKCEFDSTSWSKWWPKQTTKAITCPYCCEWVLTVQLHYNTRHMGGGGRIIKKYSTKPW